MKVLIQLKKVMEQHPTLPLIAVSGIDSTVKMFAPTTIRPRPSYNHTAQADEIIKRNTERAIFNPGGVYSHSSLLQFLASRGVVTSLDNDDIAEGEPLRQCQTQ